MDPKLVGIAWAVGVFFALQFANFLVAILANGTTPLAARLVSVFHTRWKDQRREARIHKLATLISAQTNPYPEIARLIFASAGLIISVLAAITVGSAQVEDLGPSVLLSVTDENSFRMIMKYVFMASAAVLMGFLTSNLAVVVRPHSVAEQILKKLAKQGVSERQAWGEATKLAEYDTFRVPDYRD